jgi:hypothetical protein
LEKTVEERKTKIVVLEIIREESIRENETLRDMQKKFFLLLHNIQKNWSDHMKVVQQINFMKEKYQNVQNAYSHIVQWEDVCDNPPIIFPIYTTKKNIKDQILLDTRKSILNNMENTQMKVDKVSRKLWRAVKEILEQFRMENREDLGKVRSTHTMIKDVKTKMNMSMEAIESKK